jgi:hypothetical protein
LIWSSEYTRQECKPWSYHFAIFSGLVLLPLMLKYRVIKKSLCTWLLQYRKLQVMFKVSPHQSPDIYWH